jgi:hypothetical protein
MEEEAAAAAAAAAAAYRYYPYPRGRKLRSLASQSVANKGTGSGGNRRKHRVGNGNEPRRHCDTKPDQKGVENAECSLPSLRLSLSLACMTMHLEQYCCMG